MTRPPDGRPERPLWGPDVRRDVDDELADHLAEREAELRAQGLDPETARARAREKFGDVATVRRALVTIDTAREQARRRRDAVGDLGRDVRLAFRAMRRSPGFTGAALVTLALGVGATTAIFSIVHAVILRPLPYRDPSRVAIAERRMPDGVVRSTMSYPDYLDWRERKDVFESVAAAQTWSLLADGPSGREYVPGARVSASFFSTLGVTPALGRDFTAEDEISGAEPVVIVTHRFWADRLGGQRDAIGRRLQFDDRTYRLIGVLPASFRSVIHRVPASGDTWVPLVVGPNDMTERNENWLQIVVRLAPGITLDDAQASVAVMSAPPRDSDPRFRSRTSLVQVDEHVSGAFRPALLMLLGAVGMLLLVACVNVSNLQLARTLAWRRELAVRAAIGAGRARLVVQSLTESLLLAAVGGAAGTLIAFWLLPVAVRFSPSQIPRIDEAGLDLRVLAAALSLSLLAGLLSGTLPALRASKLDPVEALRQTGARTGGRHNRVRRVLIVAEVALTVVLLSGAGLLVASFVKLVEVDPGFESDRILTLSVAPPERQPSILDDLLARVRAMPGVEHAGAIDYLPLSGAYAYQDGEAENLAEAVRAEMIGQVVKVETRWVMPGYFETLRVPLVRGRLFRADDTRRDGAIMTNGLARQLWGDADPIGRRLHVGPSEQPWIPVIGVVADVRHYGLDRDPSPTIYRLADQPFVMTLVVRTNQDPLALAPAIRQTIRDLQPLAIVRQVQTMDEVVSASVAGPRFYALAVAAFAVAAALLAGVGLFGLIAYLVGQQTHEMGIRVALGARRSQLVAMTVAGGLRVTAVGVAAGLLASLAATRLLASLLFDLSPTDPRVLAGVAVFMLAIAAAACYVPARRVFRVDPVEALRAE